MPIVCSPTSLRVDISRVEVALESGSHLAFTETRTRVGRRVALGEDRNDADYGRTSHLDVQPIPPQSQSAGLALTWRNVRPHRVTARGRLRYPLRLGRAEALPHRWRPPGLHDRRRHACLHLRTPARL